ncbi:division initiation protein [Planococcus antarcticus DSM 14505]|uniref:Cell division protein DivIB n=1 Tax=Planococcus antarcticus DSM 14505 TaxID=1185653 RepID=A0A1C7DGY6_9BACL|nr:FtsQ-type POTRA domain-containing protein [Planococcus antarcticus]ANU10473.1 division initiation protein [Planococcus antarcticus DSM 14505]EIM07790.1 division initiation protein [Planococcus antarcticus DSM 14505]
MDKVIDIEERIPTLRERRKKRTNRKFVALLFIFLTLLAVLLYSQSKYSEIRAITIEGTVLFDQESYQEASELNIGDSMWSFDAGAVSQQLESLEWVEEASVKKKWLTGVEINLKEYVQMGYLDNGNSYQVVLSNSLALDQPVTTVDGPIYSNFEKEEKREKLIDQLTQIDSEVLQLISQVILDPEEKDADYVTLYMNDGNEIRGILSTLAEKMNYYPSVIAQLKEGQQGVIDMEVGIFFRSYADVYGFAKEGAEDEATEAE